VEFTGIKSTEETKSKFLNASLLALYKLSLPQNNFPQLYRHATALT
jgi:hypothetical protein